MVIPADHFGVVGLVHWCGSFNATFDVELLWSVDPLVVLEGAPQVHVSVSPPAGARIERDLYSVIAPVRRALPVEWTIDRMSEDVEEARLAVGIASDVVQRRILLQVSILAEAIDQSPHLSGAVCRHHLGLHSPADAALVEKLEKDVQDPAVMRALAVEVRGSVEGHDRLKVRRLEGGHRELDGAEVRDSHHPDAAIAPLLFGSPLNQVEAVLSFLR